MAKLHITEFTLQSAAGLLSGENGSQTIEINEVASELSAPFMRGTKYVRVVADVNCSVKFGNMPKATVEDTWLPANTPEVFPVQSSTWVSVIGGPMTGGSLEALLQIIGDPKAAKARNDELVKAKEASEKAAADARAAIEEARISAASAAAKSADLKTRIEALEAARVEAGRQHVAADMREADLEKRERVFNLEMTETYKRLEARQAELDEKEKSIADQQAQLEAHDQEIVEHREHLQEREQAVQEAEARLQERLEKMKELAA